MRSNLWGRWWCFVELGLSSCLLIILSVEVFAWLWQCEVTGSLQKEWGAGRRSILGERPLFRCQSDHEKHWSVLTIILWYALPPLCSWLLHLLLGPSGCTLNTPTISLLWATGAGEQCLPQKGVGRVNMPVGTGPVFCWVASVGFVLPAESRVAMCVFALSTIAALRALRCSVSVYVSALSMSVHISYFYLR